MNINELVEREFMIVGPVEGSDHILKEILVQPGQSVNPGDNVCIVEFKKNNSICTITLEFDEEMYGDVVVCDILAQPGEKLGEKINDWISLFTYEVEKTFANIVEWELCSLVENEDDLYKIPAIPGKKLSNAIEKYAENVDPERVVLLYDNTVFGSGKDGFIITESALYYHHIDDYYEIRFNNIKSFKNSRKYKDRERFLIIETDDEIIKISHNTRMLDWSKMDSFLKLVMKIKEEGILKDVDQWVIVQDMSDEVKLSYIQAIVWMVYDDDGAIDKKDLAGIQMLMTRLEFTAELRYTVRLNISEPADLDIESIINRMFQKIPTGSEKSISISLVKDMVNVFHKIHDMHALESPQIAKVCKLLEVNADQLSLICQAVDFDRQLFDGSISSSETKKLARNLAGKAAAVGIPIGALYVSGSVMGLSAAGITSGLSALGLGGIFGLSSMVSGVGVAILLGVGIYKGIQWMTSEGGPKEQVRELMLQEVIRIHQKTIANLGEDISFFANNIIDLTRKVEENKLRIEKLSRYITVFSESMDYIIDREQMYENARIEEIKNREEGDHDED